MPQTINDVDTRYWAVSVSKAAPPLPERIIGGVMRPANMAKACWNPKINARKIGILSLRPKNGAVWRDFFIKGNRGVKRNA